MTAHSGTFILAVIVCSCTLMLALLFSLIVIAYSYALVAIICRYALIVYIIIHSHAITVAFSVYCYLMYKGTLQDESTGMYRIPTNRNPF